MIAALFLSVAFAREPIKIAFIETGYDFSQQWPESYTPNICGSYDPWLGRNSVTDWWGHGTVMAATAAKYLNDRKVPYCFYFVKYNPLREASLLSAYQWLFQHPMDIVNMSYEGTENFPYECPLLEQLSTHTILVAAAGNSHLNLTKYKSYPASCPRVWKVMNGEWVSNYVTTKSPRFIRMKTIMPTMCLSDGRCFRGGTSGAAALFTAKMAERLWKRK